MKTPQTIDKEKQRLEKEEVFFANYMMLTNPNPRRG